MDIICLESEWYKNLKLLQWPENSIKIYKYFLADSTKKQYNQYLESFQNFCFKKCKCFPPDNIHLSALVAEFITEKSKYSDRPESLLRGIMSALTNYFNIPGRFNPISQELKNLVKAIIKYGTVKQAGRTKVMPIQPFINMFKIWGSNESLPLMRLRQKTITLMVIACLARPSDFAPKIGFFRDQIEFHSDGSATVRFFGVKNDSDRAGFETRIEPTLDEISDPIKCIKMFFSKTAHIPPNNNGRIPAFPALKSPFNCISAQTIAQILNDSIAEAGLDTHTFSAKCFRPSAATAAIVSGCDPNTTRVRGRWKNDQVFYSNYVYPISQINVSDSIMTSNVKLYD